VEKNGDEREGAGEGEISNERKEMDWRDAEEEREREMGGEREFREGGREGGTAPLVMLACARAYACVRACVRACACMCVCLCVCTSCLD
jgi:hypothetical protein